MWASLRVGLSATTQGPRIRLFSLFLFSVVCWGRSPLLFAASPMANAPSSAMQHGPSATGTASVSMRRLAFVAPFQGAYAGQCITIGSTQFTHYVTILTRDGMAKSPIGDFPLASPNTSLLFSHVITGDNPSPLYSIIVSDDKERWNGSFAWKGTGAYWRSQFSYTNKEDNACFPDKGQSASSLAAPVDLTAIALSFLEGASGTCGSLVMGKNGGLPSIKTLPFSIAHGTLYLDNVSHPMQKDLSEENVTFIPDPRTPQGERDPQITWIGKYPDKRFVSIQFSKREGVTVITLSGTPMPYSCKQGKN